MIRVGRIENVAGKGKNADQLMKLNHKRAENITRKGYHHFLFPQCLQKGSLTVALKDGLVP